jgi:stress response protein SCP2
MNKKVLNIGLNRAKLISVPRNAKVSKRLKAIFLAELASLGYKVENPDLFNDSVLENFEDIIDELIKMKGGDVDYVPLLKGFPNVDLDEVLILTVESLVSKGIYGSLYDIMANYDETVDYKGYSSRPQMAEELADGIIDQESRESDDNAEFIMLKFTDNPAADIRKFLTNTLYAKSSIKEALKDDIQELINEFGLDFVDPTKVVFKEIKSYVMKNLWNRDNHKLLEKFVSTPTDLLRMFAAITDSDISLSDKIKFPKLRRADRKFILGILEKTPNLTENLNAYKGLWLQIGRYIHPGEYKTKFPKTYSTFSMLRNEKVVTFNSMIEKFIAKKQFGATMNLIVTRPGIFGRKLHELINIFGVDTLNAFKEVASHLELKNLLVMQKYFMTINESEFRTVINKKGKVIVFPNDKQGTINAPTLQMLLETIDNAIKSKIKENPLEFKEDSKVWIDPELRNVMVPLSMRKASDGLMNIARGTRTRIDKTKVLRMFNYWKDECTDYDLSLIEFDKSMDYIGHVSYTNLSSDGIAHSGDITSAPNGAAEFIDIDMTKLNSKAKYLAIEVMNYSGCPFNRIEKSYAGWMMRDKVDNDIKTFDIKTVTNKFNMTGEGNYAIPMIVDVDNSEIIFVDLYMNGKDNLNNVEGAVNNISTVAKEVINFVNTKPNMYDLITYQVKGSNAVIVKTKDEATVTYGIDGCTYSVDRVDEILANLI